MKLTKEEYDKIRKGKGENSFPISGFNDTNKNNKSFSDPYGFSRITEQAENLPKFAVSAKDYDNFTDYGVYLNAYTTREEAEKQRAKNQSWLEQTSRAVTQVVANEFILGSALGLSNMYDAIYNAIANDGYNDYTNALSSALENIQDSIRNRFEIYRENPNQSFDIGDFGWWADNAVSIGSTLSMLIPTTGIMSGARALGKLSRATNLYNKGLYGLGKIATGANLTNNAGRVAKAIDKSIEIGTASLLSRTMENYMEAREVYKDVLNSSIDRLKNLSESEREELYKNNPDFVGLTDDEIAQRIASTSADETFKNDYAMLLMDVVQFKALGSIWKGRTNIKPSARLKYINKQSAANLAKDIGDADIEQQGLVKRLLQHPKTYLLEELSEGIEEAYQGIQTEKGKEVAELIFDPNYRTRDLASYLTDESIWEQAFWGYLGGIGFQKIGGAIGDTYKKVEGKINKKRLSPEDYKRSQLTFEKIRESEITGRRAKLNDYLEQLSILNDGKNPLKPIMENGTIADYETITENDADVVYQQLTNNLVADMVLNAVDVGNADLLMDYITDPEFNKFFEQAGVPITETRSNTATELVNKMTKARNLYENEIYKTLNSIDGTNDLIIRNIARENVKKYFQIDNITDKLNDIETNIVSLDTKNEFNKYIDIDEYQMGINSLVELNKRIDDIYKLKDTDDIVKNRLIKDLTDKKQVIVDRLNNNIIVTELKTKDPNNIIINADETWLLNNINNEYYTDNLSSVPEAISKLIAEHSIYSYQLSEVEASIPTTKQQLQNRYNQINRILDRTVAKKLNDAFTNVGRYIETAADPTKAFNDVLAKNVPELNDDIETLNLGASDDLEYYYMLKEVRDEAITKIDRIKNNNNNNEETNKTREEILEKHPVPQETEIEDTVTNEQNNNVEETAPDSAISFTGEQERISNEEVEAINSRLTTTITEPTPDKTIPIFENEDAIEDPLAIETLTKLNESFITPSNDELDESSAFSAAAFFALQMYKPNKDLYKGISENDLTTPNAKLLIDQLKYKLELEGYNKDFIDSAAVKGLRNAIGHINRRFESKGLPNLAAQIIDSKEINDKNAITSAIPTKELNDTIDKFLEQYIKDVGIKKNKNGSTLIDIINLFDYLINNKDIGYEQAKFIYINMYDYIIDHTSNKDYNKYIFRNIRLVKDNYVTYKSFTKSLQQADYFLQQVQYAKREYITTNKKLRTAITNKVRTDVKARAIYSNLKKGDTLDIEINGKLIFFKKDDIEIGYSIIPTMSSDGNTYYMPKEKGFRYAITKNGSNYTSPYFDELFTKLAEQSEDVQDLINILYTYSANIENGAILNESLAEQETDDVYSAISEQSKKPFAFVNSKGVTISNLDGAKMIINHPLIKKLIEEGYIKVDEYKIVDSAKIIANEILSVLNYDKFAIDSESKIRSYKDWLASMYNNLQETKTIADSAIDYKISVESITTGTPVVSPISLSISDPSLKLTYDSNPIIGIMTSGTVNIEGSKSTYPSNGLKLKTMGMLLQDNDGNPAYALFDKEQNVKKEDPIYNDLKEELKSIITDRLSGGSFEEFTEKLSSLFGGNNRGFNNLFKGYSVVNVGDVTALAFKGRKDNYTLVAYRYKKDSNEESTAIRYYKNGNSNISGRVISKMAGNERLIEDIVEEILSNTQYFKTFVGLRTQDIINGKINEYISKRDGKLVITLNNKEFVYHNFGEFALKNNAFTTTQGVDRYGNYFEINKKGFYIEAKRSTPVKEDARPTLITDDYIFPDHNTKTVYSGKSIAQRAGINEDIINIAEDLNLLPKEVKYSKRDTKAKAQAGKTGILVFKNFVNAVNKDKNEAMRILIHEQLHQILESKVGDQRKEYVTEILDIYNEAKTAIINNPEKYGHLINAFNTILNPDTYFNYLDKSAKDHWNSRTQEERNALFAEEFLVESLTQKALINALNEIKSISDKAIIDKQAPKTLWQRIIDALIKIFGIKFDNIENNSILAREYNLFGNLFNDTISENINTEQDVNSVENIEVSAENIEDTIITKEQSETIEDDTFGEFDDDVFAVTDEIGNNIENFTESVNEYVNNYSEQDKPLIASFIKNGWLKIVC